MICAGNFAIVDVTLPRLLERTRTMPRTYKYRSIRERLDDLLIQIQKLEIAERKRTDRLSKLRELAQRLTNALTPVATVPNA